MSPWHFFFILSGASFISIIGEFVDASLKASTGVAAAKDAPPLNVTQTVVTQLFQLINFLMLFVIPMLTMRLVAEEKKSGTFELLVSTPLTNLDILLGKFFAALVIATGILGVCAVYPVILGFYSHPEIPVVLSCYLGLFLGDGCLYGVRDFRFGAFGKPDRGWGAVVRGTAGFPDDWLVIQGGHAGQGRLGAVDEPAFG